MPIPLRRPLLVRIRWWIPILWLVAASGAGADAEGPPPAPAPAPEASAPQAEGRDVDARLFHAVNLKPGKKNALDPFFRLLMPLGDRTAVVVPVGLYGWGRLGADKRLRDAGVFTAAAMASSALATEALKGMVARRRPVERFGDGAVRVVGERMADGRSFPSGHASNAFAWATVLSDVYPKGSAAFFGTATALAFGRVRLGAHYPSDVLAGAVIGYVAGRVVMSNRDLLMRRPEPPQGGTTMGVSRQFYF